MIKLHQLISSCFGIGYLKGGGSIAAFIFTSIWYFAGRNHGHAGILVLLTLLITAMGVRSADKVEKIWGKDNAKVVIDEVAGMCVSLLFVPLQWKYFATAFVLFRFFDIVKPLFIRNMESFSGGWGVMADDLLSGVYTNVLIQLIVMGNLF